MDRELEDNLRAFEEQLPKLLETDEGRFAVGRVGNEFSCWDTYSDAVQRGYQQYGLKPFLVQRVERPEFKRPIFIGYLAA